jgi:hypothetical protein
LSNKRSKVLAHRRAALGPDAKTLQDLLDVLEPLQPIAVDPLPVTLAQSEGRF